jgi:hypothetical protein
VNVFARLATMLEVVAFAHLYRTQADLVEVDNGIIRREQPSTTVVVKLNRVLPEELATLLNSLVGGFFPRTG